MNKLKTLFLSIIIGLAIGIVVFAFNNPPGNPPTGGGAVGVEANAPANSIYVKSDGNVGIGTTAPANKLHINSGGTGGALILQGNQSGIMHQDANGNSKFITGLRSDVDANLNFIFYSYGGNWIFNSGNVGIGTADPGTNRLKISGGNLDLSGNNITGVNKISVNTIDPIFKINGQWYVTYTPDSIGQKVEVVGAAQLVNGEWSIDLAKQTNNSALWLFYQIVKPESIIPFVSSQSPASLYAFLEGSELVVKVKDGDPQARFSYRLMADRIDSQGNDYLLPATEANEVYIDVDSLKK